MNSQSPKTPEQLLADNLLQKKIAQYSTMRVHMKRVQLCLEQEKRNKFYKELLIYVVFLVLVMSSLLSLPVHFPYEQNAAMSDLFFDEEFPDISIRKTFDDIMIEDELWQWVQGPLLAGFYDLPTRNTRRIGSVLIRAGRVKGDLCRYTDGRSDFVLFANEFCYPEFSKHMEDTEAYGDAATSALKAKYEWDAHLGKLLRSQTFTPSLFNHEMDYGHGGYAVYLPRDNVTAAEKIVEQLKEDFLTDSTRYFAASFAFYNARSNIFTHVQALVEMSDTDYMETTARVKSFRIMPSYKDEGFYWANIFVVVLIIVTIWLIYRELVDLREYGWQHYIQSLWNLLDLLQLVLLILFLETWASYLVQGENIRDQLYQVARMDCNVPAHAQKIARDCFVDVEPLAWRFKSVTNYAAALALVSVAIVFKYLRLNTRLNLLWRTLRFAAKDLLAFVIIFFVIFFAYAIMGFLTFGSSVRQYHSLSVSLTSCFQMLLGAFDYNLIYNGNPAMAGLFFFTFMISVYLICVNMFIAIMSEYYSLAQAEKKEHEANQKLLATNGEHGDGKGGHHHNGNDCADGYADVEYDLLKQVQAYLRGLRVRVRLPPTKGDHNSFMYEQVLLSGYQRVLLVDYDYLMAERKRLRTKCRAAVQASLACAYLLRRVRGAEFKMQVEHKLLVDRRPRASSVGSFTDLAEFPVTYIPITSSRAKPVELLKSLKPGMLVDMDDGSLTKDQITLEVLGNQDAYIPPRYRRRPPHSQSFHDGAQDDTDDHLTDLQVPISETEDDNDDSRQQSSTSTAASPVFGPGRRPFGLRHDHEDIGSASHIRCCRVLYDGDTVLDGMEACLFPRRVWASYFLRHVVWGAIKRFFTFRHKKRRPKRLITDSEVDRLIKEYFVAPGRGISCRFDELVRNFRMLIAKKIHKKNLRISNSNLEDRIFVEVITFLERFPSALSPLDKRELEGYKYTPQPVDTSRVRIPNSILLLAELLAQNAHEVWAVGRIQQGWRWGPSRDNDKLLHPDLLPYEELTEETKQYDRDTSMEALKVISALGFVLQPSLSGSDDFDIEFGVATTEPGGTYEPRPIHTEAVKVPAHLRSLIELLAENTHEVWAKMRMDQGWKYGPRRDDEKREHNGLVPYIYLTQDEKQMDRNTAMQTVKAILRCGFTFVHKDKVSSSRATRKKHSGSSIRMFGRNENPEAANVGDAVTLARGAARAKRAFMKRGTGHSGFGQSSSRSFTNRTLSAASSASSQSGQPRFSQSESFGIDEHVLESSGSLSDFSERSESTRSLVLEPHSAPDSATSALAGATPTLQHSSTLPDRIDTTEEQDGKPPRPPRVSYV
ncbi:hypothetical protein Poli38472_006350 [Pythium oligandrum]|uniref:Ryanodine-inositol 1,4,5-triphosphate receptor Ca2 channel (RIR-CaC) family protein n=1 Tax=Pythium oligandrum TaxID=41045 RepID=A0A8K1FAK7_PYTOL|nr:hypothetical protein Poli38472_006350 [Pythium oligandrum]|eukprot:TMW56340.1 hypothetical protein Poli38472_006350 [Pythium oligandrum]